MKLKVLSYLLTLLALALLCYYGTYYSTWKTTSNGLVTTPGKDEAMALNFESFGDVQNYHQIQRNLKIIVN